jgi:O-acetyl-ADP-ribose deacetylase (regulator of RNase III)
LIAGSVTIGLREEKEKDNSDGLLGEDDGEDAGQAASVALGTGGTGVAALAVDSLHEENYRDRDSMESEQGEVELVDEGYQDKHGRSL